MKLFRLLILLVSLLSMGQIHARPLVIGVLAWQENITDSREWQALKNVLDRQSFGSGFELKPMKRSEIEHALAAHSVDLVLSSPGDYVFYEHRFGLSRIATLVVAPASLPTDVLASSLIVRADRNDIHSINDLKGKRLATVSNAAFGGYQMFAGQLKNEGITINEWFGSIEQTGLPHDNVLAEVSEGRADVGVVRSCFLEASQLRGNIHALNLKVILRQTSGSLPCAISTRVYPGWALGVANHVDPSLTHHLALALLQAPPLQDGTYWTVPTDYSSIHGLLQKLVIRPYDMRSVAFEDVWSVYRSWILATLISLLLLLVYGFRITLQAQKLRTDRRLLREQWLKAHDKQQLPSPETYESRLLPNLNELTQLQNALKEENDKLNQQLLEGMLDRSHLQDTAHTLQSHTKHFGETMQAIRQKMAQYVPHFHRENINKLIQQSVHFFQAVQPNARPMNLDLPNPAMDLRIDSRAIQQVLLTFLRQGNAALQDDASELYLSLMQRVQDIHFTLSNQPQLFDYDEIFPLSTEKPSTHTPHKTPPSGLSICKTIIEAHGGTLAWHFPEDSQTERLILEFTLPISCLLTQSDSDYRD